jgi:hypothetical protein
MISSSALMTAVPEASERGAFMSVNSSLQQISGGIASIVAGLIVVQTNNGPLKHYDVLGYIVVGSIILTMVMMRSINSYVMQKAKTTTVPHPSALGNITITDKEPIVVNG